MLCTQTPFARPFFTDDDETFIETIFEGAGENHHTHVTPMRDGERKITPKVLRTADAVAAAVAARATDSVAIVAAADSPIDSVAMAVEVRRRMVLFLPFSPFALTHLVICLTKQQTDEQRKSRSKTSGSAKVRLR